MGIYNIIENSYNFNDFDKLKFLLPHSYAKTESDKLSSYFLGGNYRYLQKQTVLEVSSKLYADENNVGSFTSSNLYYLAKKVYERSRLKIDEEYLFNKATLCRVDVKKDIFVEDQPSYYFSELREVLKQNTDRYEINPYKKMKYINGLVLLPKLSSYAHRIVCYNKYEEIKKNKNNDYGYFNNFNDEYLEKLKYCIRFECQFNSFSEIRRAFNISTKGPPTINEVIKCNTDVVAKKVTELLTGID